MKKVNTSSFFKFSEDFQIRYKNLISCFYFDDDRYFFKFNDEQGTIFEAELLATKIGEKLGIDVLHVEPAVFVDQKNKEYLGVMSKNFFADNLTVHFDIKSSALLGKTTYDGIVSGVKEYLNRTSILQPEMNVKLESNFYNKLRDMIFFDFLTFQSDRYLRNVEFFLKKSKDGWTFCLAPIFDNSWIFAFQERGYGKYNPTKNYVSDYVKNHAFILGYSQYQDYRGMKNDILKVFHHNQRLKTLAVRAYNIDIEQCIAEIENDYPGYVFDPLYKQAAKNCWDVTKRTLKVDFDVENLIKEIDEFEK